MRRVLLAAATFALLGFSCPDSSSTTGGSTSYVGTYTLISAGGHSLPAPSGDSTQTITAGNVTLSSDGTFVYNETRNPVQGNQGSSGTYTISGVDITFNPSKAGDTGATGVFTNNGATLTVTPGGEPVLVFTKN